MNATEILEKIIKEKDKFYFNHEYTDWLRETLERIKSLPSTISQEDIDKLQRYYYQKHWMVLEYDDSRTDWLYIRYDDLISLLTK